MSDTQDRLAKIEDRLRQIELGGQSATLPAGVASALAEGNYIESIKRLREATGMGLAEAKRVIDQLQPERVQRRRMARSLVAWTFVTLIGLLIYWYAGTRLK
jgi:hypothetical protein